MAEPPFSHELSIAAGALATVLFLAPLLGLPRFGVSERGPRRVSETLFHVALGVLSIGLLGFSMLARDLLARFEPFASSRVLLEISCAVALLLAVSPLVALLGVGPRFERTPPPPVTPGVASVRALVRFALALPALLLLEACVLVAARGFGMSVAAQGVLDEFHGADLVVRGALALTVVLAGPVAEEVVFRGTLQPALARLVGADLARLATAILFALLHPTLAWVPIGLLGYFLGRVRDAWGSVVPCIAIHAANNALMLVLYASSPWVRGLYAAG